MEPGLANPGNSHPNSECNADSSLQRRDKLLTWLLVTFIIGFGLFLRIQMLDAKFFENDESGGLTVERNLNLESRGF